MSKEAIRFQNKNKTFKIKRFENLKAPDESKRILRNSKDSKVSHEMIKKS